MNSQELITLKQLGPQGVIRRYLPRLGKPLEEGGITKEMYDQLLRLVTPCVPANPGKASGEGTGCDPSLSPPDEIGGETLKDSQAYSTPVTPRTSSQGAHSDPQAGRSQKARILALLQDHQFHDTTEIMTKVYKVGDDRGNCRIPSRICELRQEGHKIETKRINKTLTAYRLV